MNRWKIGGVLALLLGLALTVGMVVYVGADGLLKAVERVGLGGFTIFVIYNLAVFLPLGWAWWSVAPGVGFRGSLLFPLGRLVRESASDVLPFSQVGGLVAGLHAVQQRRLSEPLAVASQIVDLSTEMAAQLFYSLFGVLMLVAILSHATASTRLLWSAGLALVVGTASLAAFIALQGRGLDLIAAVVGRWVEDTRQRADAVKAILRSIYAKPQRLAGGVLLHGLCWILSGAGSWLALGFMGVHVELWKVLTLESLLAAVKSVSFLMPGALGLQEGAYVLAAPLFGLTAEVTLAVSLLRRAKDLLIGVPVILAWQYADVVARARTPSKSAPATPLD